MEKCDLSRPMQRLIEQCQMTNFGRIRFAVRRGGEPDLVRPWRTVRTVKLAGGENGSRPESASANFHLRTEHLAMVSQLATAGDGALVTIEVKHGLPFLVEIEQDTQAA